MVSSNGAMEKDSTDLLSLKMTQNTENRTQNAWVGDVSGAVCLPLNHESVCCWEVGLHMYSSIFEQ